MLPIVLDDALHYNSASPYFWPIGGSFMKKSLLILVLSLAFVGCAKTEKEKVDDANKSSAAGQSLYNQGAKQQYMVELIEGIELSKSPEITNWKAEDLQHIKNGYVGARAKLIEARSYLSKALDTAKDVENNKGAKDSIINVIYDINQRVSKIEARLKVIEKAQGQKPSAAERLERKRTAA